MTAAQAGGAAAAADLLEIDGTASLGGKVQVNMDVGDGPAAGAQSAGPFLTATGGVTDEGLSVESTVAATYSLDWSTAGAVALDYQLDFASAGARAAARPGHAPVTRHLQTMYEAGSLSREEGNALANIADPDAYREAIASLSGEIYADTQNSALQSSLRFGDAMMSCAERSDAYRFIAEGQCSWMLVGGSRFSQEGSGSSMGFDETTFSLAGGLQADAGNDWHFGAAFSYENRNMSKDGMMSSDGDMFQLGGVAKREFGPALVAASLAVGYGRFDIERETFLGDTARGDQDLWTLSGQIRGEYLLERGNLFAKPRLDLGVDVIRTGKVRETGADGFNHEIDGATETYVNLQPAVEFGAEWQGTDGTLFRPTLMLGVTQFLGDGAPEVDSLFEDSPSGAPRITASSQFDKLYGDVALGLQVLSAKGLSVDAGAFGSFSENTERYGASLKVSIPF
ncbi:autotransporter outer membrane beta-barrel domain-containing protein [Mangrovicoccus ximenensis]|uniref:autotransporter outer membrane beta-barrel domain-containing protein n=1 Tax=Mangrovicoccus ximenensis TaxID=1911570 RepID=UPI000D39EF9A|nr:autotransporter outer membrane beta-barrel domain-containing protein [Mangrovicoccus ximenensis]